MAAESLDENNTKPTHVANFLAHLFSEGAGYSAVNSARSALSAYSATHYNSLTFGAIQMCVE